MPALPIVTVSQDPRTTGSQDGSGAPRRDSGGRRCRSGAGRQVRPLDGRRDGKPASAWARTGQGTTAISRPAGVASFRKGAEPLRLCCAPVQAWPDRCPRRGVASLRPITGPSLDIPPAPPRSAPSPAVGPDRDRGDDEQEHKEDEEAAERHRHALSACLPPGASP
jgi:hypothetical protein